MIINMMVDTVNRYKLKETKVGKVITKMKIYCYIEMVRVGQENSEKELENNYYCLFSSAFAERRFLCHGNLLSRLVLRDLDSYQL